MKQYEKQIETLEKRVQSRQKTIENTVEDTIATLRSTANNIERLYNLNKETGNYPAMVQETLAAVIWIAPSLNLHHLPTKAVDIEKAKAAILAIQLEMEEEANSSSSEEPVPMVMNTNSYRVGGWPAQHKESNHKAEKLPPRE